MNSRCTSLMVLVLSLLMTPFSANAQERSAKARERIEALLDQAERSKKEGDLERAEALTKKAQDLRAELANAKRRDDRARDERARDERARDDRARDERARDERVRDERAESAEIIRGLKAGAASLRALKRFEEAEKLERLAAELREKSGEGRKRDLTEREVALNQLRTMRFAVQGLVAAERKELAAQMEYAIRSLELRLEGVRNEKAAAIHKKAPKLGQRVELLMFAARVLREAGKKEQAQAVGNLGEQLLKRFRASQKQEGREQSAERQHDNNHRERQVAAEQIEVMQTALVALREGEQKELAEVLKRAIQARTVRLQGSKGEEAQIVLRREPKLEETVRALKQAAELWGKFGNEKNAGHVEELADRFSRHVRGQNTERTRGEAPRRKRPDRRRKSERQERGKRRESDRSRDAERRERDDQRIDNP